MRRRYWVTTAGDRLHRRAHDRIALIGPVTIVAPPHSTTTGSPVPAVDGRGVGASLPDETHGVAAAEVVNASALECPDCHRPSYRRKRQHVRENAGIGERLGRVADSVHKSLAGAALPDRCHHQVAK